MPDARRVLPWPLRGIGRALLQLWGATGLVPGWRYQVIERWGALLAEDTPLAVRMAGGLSIRTDLHDYVERFAYFMGVSEPIESHLFARLLTRGMTVVDGGANNGQYTLLAARTVGPSGRVIAFEPVPFNIAKLEHHIRINGLENVTIHRLALWDSAATLRFAQPADYADNAGTWGAGITGAASYLEVAAASFDDLGIQGPIGFVKLDIEGSELRALRGMRRMIERDHPLMLVELSRGAAERAGASIDELFAFLTATLGYRLWRIGSTPALSGPITDSRSIENANAICYHGAPPAQLAEGWDYREVLKWARSGDL